MHWFNVFKKKVKLVPMLSLSHVQQICRFKLFYLIIKRILCYRAQVWGHTYSEVVESVHFDFCKRYLKLRSKKTRTLSELTKIPPLRLKDIWTDRRTNIFPTGIILLHAHPQVVYCNCVWFHQNRSSR